MPTAEIMPPVMAEPVLYPKLTITGDIGSGKSAVSKLLAAATDFPRYSTGDLQRRIAARYGMSTLELNRFAETHREIDDEIDGATIELGRRDESFIIDSRIAWHFIPQAFKVYLTVAPEIAAERILGDGARRSEAYDDLETAVEKIRQRRRSEVERFREIYGIDLDEMSNYDLVVDTSDQRPDAVAAEVLTAFRAWAAG